MVSLPRWCSSSVSSLFSARQVQEDQAHRAAHVHRRPPALRLDLGRRGEASFARETQALAALGGVKTLLLHTEVLARVEKEEIMPIQDAVSIHDVMSTDILTVRPEERIPEAARRLSERNVGAAIVEPETRRSRRPGIIAERDVLKCVASGREPEYMHVADLFTPEAMTIPPDSSLQQAAKVMTSDGFRHLIVFDGEETLGIVSIRDIVGRWSKEGQLLGLGTQIREAMTTEEVFAVGLEDTLREAARKMGERGIGAAMVKPAKKGRP